MPLPELWDVSQPALSIERTKLPGWKWPVALKTTKLSNWGWKEREHQSTRGKGSTLCKPQVRVLRSMASMGMQSQDRCSRALENYRHWEYLGWGEVIYQTWYLSGIVIPSLILDSLFSPEKIQNRFFGTSQILLLISSCHVLFFKLFSPDIFQSSKGYPVQSDLHHSEAGLCLTMQMIIFQRLWHQLQEGTCKADTHFSSEPPSLLLNHSCACSNRHIRCLGPSSPGWQLVFSAGQIQAVKCSSWRVQPAGGIGTTQTVTSLGQT